MWGFTEILKIRDSNVTELNKQKTILNLIFKDAVESFLTLPQAQLFDTNISSKWSNTTTNTGHTQRLQWPEEETTIHTHIQYFMAVERWVDYSFPHYGIRRGGQGGEETWGRMDWWIKENWMMTQTTKCHKHMLFFGGGALSNPGDKQWLVHEGHPDVSWWKRIWRGEGVCTTSQTFIIRAQCFWQWLDRRCSNSGVALAPVVAIGATVSHANQLTWRWKHSHLKCSFCHFLPGFRWFASLMFVL